jgi:hypothetical protein
MDCKTARLLLDFVRPQAGEVDSAELAAFEQHVAACPECDSLVRAERGLDRAYAKAMKAVEVPASLRGRLTARLERERGDVYLRWFGNAGRVAAAAAVVVLATWAVIAWRQSHLPQVDIDRAWDEAHSRMVAPPSGDFLADHFRRLGFEGPFPQNLNYRLLTYYGLGELQGRRVPQLIFLAPGGGAHAEVRVLSAKQFNLANLPLNQQAPEGYPCKVEVWSDPAGCAELVDYTGGSATWLQADPPREEATN